MFTEMRTVLNIPKSVDILHHIDSLPTADERQSAMAAVQAVESRAMLAQQAQPGLAELMSYLDSRAVPKAILTRNFAGPVSHLLSKFLPDSVIHPVVTREFRPAKPDPAGIWHIAERWGMGGGEDGEEEKGAGDAIVPDGDGAVAAAPPVVIGTSKAESLAKAAEGLIMVGDSFDDMAAGRRSGAATVLLVNDVNRELASHDFTDLVVESLHDLIPVLESGFVGREIVPSGPPGSS